MFYLFSYEIVVYRHFSYFQYGFQNGRQRSRDYLFIIKLEFLCFSHWFLAITFLFSMLPKCDRDESSTGKLASIFPKGPKFVTQTDFGEHR